MEEYYYIIHEWCAYNYHTKILDVYFFEYLTYRVVS